MVTGGFTFWVPFKDVAPLHPVPEAVHEEVFVDVHEMTGKSAYEDFALATILVLFVVMVRVEAATLCALTNAGKTRNIEVTKNIFTFAIVMLFIHHSSRQRSEVSYRRNNTLALLVFDQGLLSSRTKVGGFIV